MKLTSTDYFSACVCRVGPCRWLLGLCALAASCAGTCATRLVGPGAPYATPCAAILAAAPGDEIRIDAAGSYAGDVCAWNTSSLSILGYNGRPHIDAAGNSAGGKATWVITGNDTLIDNVELSGAKAVDANGAGIRQEGANLTLRHAWMHDNQNGILAGDNAASTILIEYSEFSHNGAGDGQSHNLYIGHVAALVFRYNYSHAAVIGHLLKSRALQNEILYNRLSGETGSSESYEIDLPSGGLSFVIGNVVQKPASSPNGAMLEYRNESAGLNPDDRLFVVNNTFVSARANTRFLFVLPTTVTPVIARNNLFIGAGTVSSQTSTVSDHNFSGGDPLFVDAAGLDYHLQPASPAIDAGTPAGNGAGQDLTPLMQYLHPADGEVRRHDATLDVGAYEFAPDRIFCSGFDAGAGCI